MDLIIGVVARPTEKSYGRFGWKMSDEIKELIVQNKMLPFLITGPSKFTEKLNDQEIIRLEKQLSICDGVILQGGNNNYPYDKIIVSYLYENDIPTFGVCLGMQTMSEVFSGHIKTIERSGINHSQSDKEYVHINRIIPNSKLHKLLNVKEIKVNSRHNDMVDSTNLFVSARSTDGIIEAVEDIQKNFFVGVQWHPESMIEYDKLSRILWKEFFNSARRYHGNKKCD